MDKETSYRPALFGRDGQYLLRVRGIRLTPDSPEPWVAWPGLSALTNSQYKDKVVHWFIHREWNAAFALPEVISESTSNSPSRRLMASGQLVDCGPVPDAQRQMLKHLASSAGRAHVSNSIPADVCTEEDFRTLAQMLVRDRFRQDPVTTFYVSGRSGFDLSRVDSDVWAAPKDFEVTDAPITDKTTQRWGEAREAWPVAAEPVRSAARPVNINRYPRLRPLRPNQHTNDQPRHSTQAGCGADDARRLAHEGHQTSLEPVDTQTREQSGRYTASGSTVNTDSGVHPSRDAKRRRTDTAADTVAQEPSQDMPALPVAAAAVHVPAAAGLSQPRADTHAAEQQRMPDLLRAKGNTIQQLTQDREGAAVVHEAALQEARVTIQQLRQQVKGHTRALHDKDAALQQLTQTVTRLTQTNTRLTHDLAARDETVQHLGDTVHQLMQDKEHLARDKNSAVARVTQSTQERDALKADNERLRQESEHWEIRALKAELALHQAQSALHQAQGEALAKRLAERQRVARLV